MFVFVYGVFQASCSSVRIRGASLKQHLRASLTAEAQTSQHEINGFWTLSVGDDLFLTGLLVQHDLRHNWLGVMILSLQ